MDDKPKTAAGYDQERTNDCEVALVILLRAFASLKDTLRLVGGLVPRYLTPAAPPDVPLHAGTRDVDVVLNVELLADRGTYRKLKGQLKDAGFRRVGDGTDKVSSWQWEIKFHGRHVIVEFLHDTDDPEQTGRLTEIDGEEISALQILHAGVAGDWFEEKPLRVELPDKQGVAVETVRYADATAFIILKAIAFDTRHEPKDAADLLHVMQYAFETTELLAQRVMARCVEGRHEEAIDAALQALKRRFCSDEHVEGHDKDGPALAANFHGYAAEGLEDDRATYLRQVSAMVTRFVALLEAPAAP